MSRRFSGRRAILATKHEKERAIAPVLAELSVEVARGGLDTDVFGTFTGEIPRAGSPLDAARKKIGAAMRRHPEEDLFLASEGSFGPHPHLLAAADHELIVLFDRRDELELVAEYVTFETNHRAIEVQDTRQLAAAASAIGLPSHAAVVRAGERFYKGIFDPRELEAIATRELARAPVVVEADLRAMCNPTRMVAIEHAARALVAAMRAECPSCARPGFVPREVRRGLPCEECGTATNAVAADVIRCDGCGETQEHARGDRFVPARWCEVCNP